MKKNYEALIRKDGQLIAVLTAINSKASEAFDAFSKYARKEKACVDSFKVIN